MDELRRRRNSELPLDWFDDRLRPEDEEERRDSDEVLAAVRSLPPARREVIVLYYWLDLPVDEIAARLDVPFGTTPPGSPSLRHSQPTLLAPRRRTLGHRAASRCCLYEAARSAKELVSVGDPR
jgi:Sigma-70, region 4